MQRKVYTPIQIIDFQLTTRTFSATDEEQDSLTVVNQKSCSLSA
jgi:hypothetical protein